MEFAELKKHLNNEKPHACYACYGDDSYVLSRAVALISGLAGEPRPFNIVDKEFGTARELTDELMQLPLMSSVRVVIARGKIDVAAVGEYLKKPNDTTVLVVVTYIKHDSWGHDASPVIPQGATPVVCNRLDIKYVIPFVRSAIKDSGAVISDAAVRKLYDRCGGYMTRINSEAQKLAFMRAGAEITSDDVEELVNADTEFVVFELGDSILAGNGARALEIVNGMAKNNDLVAAFTLLYNRFKKIFAAAVDPDGLAGLGVKPYQANKLKGESGKFSKARLKSMLDLLAKADYDYKTGAMSQYDALTAFVARAAGGVK